MKKYFLQIFTAIFAFVCLCISVSAQDYAETFAITNAQIMPVSSGMIQRGTIIVRNGLIEKVGANLQVPADARVIDGNGLTIYPGFFDTNSSYGLPTQPAQRRRQQTRGQGQTQNQQPDSNSNYPEGLQPEEKAFDELKAGEAQFEQQRNTGITTALTVESDGIFNGQSAVINLAGDSVSAMILREPFAEHITFRTLNSGEYPTSLMGTFSALRQMFLDAQRLIEYRKIYATNPRGIRRPDEDASLEALIPIVLGQMPVVLNANSEREIIRALDLAKEFNLKAIIAGGFESGKVASRLKTQNVPVLLSLDFPKRTTAASKDADPEPLELLRLRAEVPKNAARLKQAGVKFAFSSGGMKDIKNFLANAEETTENGLNKTDALRAMTLDAAEILGVDKQLGSIEEGKIANLVVSRGDIFDNKKVITHVFVDGKLFEQKEKPKDEKPTNTGGKTANVGGAYNITIEVPGQPTNGSLRLVQQGSTLTGSLTTQFGTSQISDGKVTADGFTFSTRVEFEGNTLELFAKGTIIGDNVEGTFTIPDGAISFTGTRIP